MPPELLVIQREDYAVACEAFGAVESELDYAPPADPTIDADIEEMTDDEVEDELYRIIYGCPAG